MEFIEPVRVNTDVLLWARERLGLSPEQVAALTGFSSNQIRSWEEEESEPTYRQAVEFSRKCQFPFGYLLLSVRPQISLPLPDLRTVSGAPPRLPTPNLQEVLEDAIRKQHWYAEYLREQGAKPIPFVGKFTLSEKTETIASDIRQKLEINEQTRNECPAVGQFLTRLVRNAEEVGIIVLRSGTACGNTRRPLDVEEFRGFALVDKFAPLVFVNTRDALVAQIFTFAHEVAHIWLGQEGISNPNFYKKSSQQINQIEAKCNQIAAEVLVPRASFVRAWNEKMSDENNIVTLRRLYRVSSLVVMRKAFDSDLITESNFRKLLKVHYELELARKNQKKEDEKSSGNYYNNLYARNSTTLTAAIASAYSSGQILVTEAANLLSVGSMVLDKLVSAS